MGILLSAMAAAGDAGVKSMDQNIEQMNRMDLDSSRADLEQKKQVAIMQARAQIDNAPSERAGALIRDSAQGEAPNIASPVAMLSGTDPQSPYKAADGSPTVGFHGSYDDAKAKVMAIPDEGLRNEGLAQLERQRAADTATAQATAGTHPRTPDEAMADAIQQAKAKGDLQALAVLKAAAPEKFTKLADGEMLIDSTTGRPVLTNTTKSDRQIAVEQYKELHADSRAALDRQNRMDIARLKDDDPQFVKELKTLYPNGGPEYDEALRQRINKETGVNAAGGGGRSVVYNGRIIASGNEIAAALNNITQLPVGSNAGFLGSGKAEGSGILSATAAGLKNELNSDEVKTYNTMWTGISRNLGTLETSGLATTGSLIASIDKLQIVPGDNGYNVQRKLAEVRQIVDAALEPKLSDPTVPPEQKKYIEGVIEKVASAVPYTHSDLTRFRNAQQKDPTLSLADFAKQTVNAPSTPSANTPAVLTYDPKTGTFH